jgi:hypothetical protein
MANLYSLVPFVFTLSGIAWFVLLQAPCIDIVCYSSHHPYRQEWDDSGGHQILFRVDIVMIVMLTPRPCRFE